MARSTESLILEVDYWKAALDDLATMNDLVLAASRATVSAAVPHIHLALLVRTEADVAGLDAYLASRREALDALGKIGDALGCLIALATGRSKAIAAEIAETIGGDDG